MFLVQLFHLMKLVRRKYLKVSVVNSHWDFQWLRAKNIFMNSWFSCNASSEIGWHLSKPNLKFWNHYGTCVYKTLKLKLKSNKIKIWLKFVKTLNRMFPLWSRGIFFKSFLNKYRNYLGYLFTKIEKLKDTTYVTQLKLICKYGTFHSG